MNLLVVAMGVMFGVAGANNAVKAMAKALGNGVEKQLMRRALTKGTIYPIVKSIAKWFGVRMTKEVFSGFYGYAVMEVCYGQPVSSWELWHCFWQQEIWDCRP